MQEANQKLEAELVGRQSNTATLQQDHEALQKPMATSGIEAKSLAMELQLKVCGSHISLSAADEFGQYAFNAHAGLWLLEFNSGALRKMIADEGLLPGPHP